MFLINKIIKFFFNFLFFYVIIKLELFKRQLNMGIEGFLSFSKNFLYVLFELSCLFVFYIL